MASKQYIILLLLIGLFLSQQVYGQEKCATNELSVNKQESTERFELWMKQIRSTHKSSTFNKNIHGRTQAVIQIPVVVHVIHQGESIGEGSNISEAQVLSQIEVLNEDFRRMNADAINTPEVFQPVAADIEIEFILARQDPDGLPTSGIVRKKGAKTSWHPENDQINLSEESYWPAEDYLNIWVTNLTSPYLGYAQFPVSDLPGLEGNYNNRLTDGVVINYRAFGSILKDPNANLVDSYNLGRTTTHEVGHFLGLRHIWGDGGCSLDDYAADTPVAANSNTLSNCSFPGPNSCGENTAGDLPDMFQNFMDYTDDKCMNLFTMDQKARIQVVMSESPRRASLITSHGLQEPLLSPLDLEIKNVLDPIAAICSGVFTPKIVIRNYGEEMVSSAVINVFEKGILLESLEVLGLSLHTYEIDTITFGTKTITNENIAELSFEIVLVNGENDASKGNLLEIEVPVLEVQPIPFIEDFESFSAEEWNIKNPDGSFTWAIENAPSVDNLNKAISASFYLDENIGTQDWLISQPFKIPDNSPALLSFDVAYARYRDETLEGLKVVLSTDCGSSYPHVIYEKYGAQLETKSPQTAEFIPGGINHWRKEIIDISQFEGQDIRIAFIAVNEWGNNLYIDNVSIFDEPIVDLQASEILSPTPAQCFESITPSIVVKNTGNTPVSNATIEVQLNGKNAPYIFDLPMPLSIGSTTTLEFPVLQAQEGFNIINFEIIAVNDQLGDNFNYNNHLSQSFLIDNTHEALPLRENFEDFENSTWSFINIDNGLTWELTSEDNNKLASFPSEIYFNPGDEDWILSPVMDFTHVNEAAFFFDVAYEGEGPDRLYIVYTDNCGLSYQPLGFDKSGEELQTYSPGENKKAVRQYVSLHKLIGKDNVRLAIIAEGGEGKNIEVDNIEIFLTDYPIPVIPPDLVALYPNPARGLTKLSFNLNKKEDIQITVIDGVGKVIVRHILPNTLNQTHELDMTTQPDGIYYIKIRGLTFQTTKRLVIY